MNYCEKNIFQIRERWEVLIAYLSLGRHSGGDCAITWHWTKLFKNFLLKQGVVATLLMSRFC
jgi:hypothetical protein